MLDRAYATLELGKLRSKLGNWVPRQEVGKESEEKREVKKKRERERGGRCSLKGETRADPGRSLSLPLFHLQADRGTSIHSFIRTFVRSFSSARVLDLPRVANLDLQLAGKSTALDIQLSVEMEFRFCVSQARSPFLLICLLSFTMAHLRLSLVAQRERFLLEETGSS